MNITFAEVGRAKLTEAEKLLAGIPNGVERAVKSAMTRATAHLRTNAVREVRKRYAISAANLRTEDNCKIRYSYSGGNVRATVFYSGKKIPLYRYDGTSPKTPQFDRTKLTHAIITGGYWRTVHPGIAAKGRQLVSQTPTIPRDGAFIAHFASTGHTGIFYRTGGMTDNDLPEIREVMGSAFAQMLGNEEVAQRLAEGAMEKFEERLDHEVYRLLNGFGG